jgi:hypothetical protein
VDLNCYENCIDEVCYDGNPDIVVHDLTGHSLKFAKGIV